MSNAKEIEIQEIQYVNQFYAENDRVVRRYFQTFCAFAANLLFFCYGIIFLQSGLLIPQFEDPEIGFGIDKEKGSWFGKKNTIIMN